MTYYRAVGSIPKKRHYQMRNDEGGLFKEELMGVEGFSSDSSLLYHRYSPPRFLLLVKSRIHLNEQP